MPIRSLSISIAKLVFAAFAVCALASGAEAQLLTFVSATGVDTRPCTVEAQPCKTLQRAVAVTAEYGTIRILSDLVVQPNATITQSVTVEGSGKSVLGTFVINNVYAKVIFRGLHLTGDRTSANAMRIYKAESVHIEDCTVERYKADGIWMVSSEAGSLLISRTAMRENLGSGVYVSGAYVRAEINDSRFDRNGNGGLNLKAREVNVTRTVASGNAIGIYLDGGAANVSDSTATNNSSSGFSFVGALTPIAGTLTSSLARGNGNGVSVTTGATLSISDSTIISSIGGNAIFNRGTLYTFKNNAVGGTVDGPAPIALSAW